MSIKTRYNEYKEYIEKLKLAAYSPVWETGEHLDKEDEINWLENTQNLLCNISNLTSRTEIIDEIKNLLILSMSLFVSSPCRVAYSFYAEANAIWLYKNSLFLLGSDNTALGSSRELLDELRKKDSFTISNTFEKAKINMTDASILRNAISTNNLSDFEMICSKYPAVYEKMLIAFGLFKYGSMTLDEYSTYTPAERAYVFESKLSSIYQQTSEDNAIEIISNLQNAAKRIREQEIGSYNCEVERHRMIVLTSDQLIQWLESEESKYTLLPEEQQIFSKILSHPIRRHVRVVDGNVEVSLTPFTENVDNSVKEEQFILPEDFFDNDKYIVTGSDDYYFHVEEHNIIGDNKSGFKAFRHNANAIQNFVDGLAAHNYIDNSLESKRLMVFKLTGRKFGIFDETQPVNWKGPHMIPFSMSRTFFKFKGKFEKVGDLFDFAECMDFDKRAVKDSNGKYPPREMSTYVNKALNYPGYSNLVKKTFHIEAK